MLRKDVTCWLGFVFRPYDQGESLPNGLRFSCSFFFSGSRIITAAFLNTSAA